MASELFTAALPNHLVIPPALGSVEMSSNPEDLVSSKPKCKRSEPDAAVETAAKTEGPNAVNSANDPVNKADVTASVPMMSETAGQGSGSANGTLAVSTGSTTIKQMLHKKVSLAIRANSVASCASTLENVRKKTKVVNKHLLECLDLIENSGPDSE